MASAGWLGLGGILAVAFVVVAQRRGAKRELRALAVGLVVAALVYVVAAAIGPAIGALAIEGVGLLGFAAVAVAGARRRPMLLATGWALHVFWDVGLHIVTRKSYIGTWYPTLCISFDLVVASYLAWRVAGGSLLERRLR